MSSSARSVFRLLLRTRADVFRGDARALGAARDEIRAKFELTRGETDPARVEELLKDGRDAAAFMREFVVQAAVNERGNLEVALTRDHADKELDIGSAETDAKTTR